jgi:phosphatidylserine/phosphatidylglycerophosphate/cardiolipin synthase-like enzyme
MIDFLRSPWDKHFESLITQAQSSLVISSPYIGRGPCNKILEIKSRNETNHRISILLVTDISRDTLLSGATDISAICDMADRLSHIEIRFLPSIHAKVYVADDDLAVVTSANMTDSGLTRNFEYGVKITDANFVSIIKRDVAEYAALGTKIDYAKLRFLSEISAELAGVRAKVEKGIRSRLRREFDRRLRSFDEEIIRARAAGRAPHAIFAEAILYLLARRPLSTAEIHPFIQGIHPDLCDDTVDRVIDGKHFGKKWKHAVRTAQQYLKRTGQIELRKGVWYLRRG